MTKWFFPSQAVNQNRYCQFHVLPSCEVKNFSISLTKGPPFLTGIQYPLQGGGNVFLFGFGLLSVAGWSWGYENHDF